MDKHRRDLVLAGTAGPLVAACGSGTGSGSGSSSGGSPAAAYGTAGDVDTKTRYAEITATPFAVKTLSVTDDSGRSQRWCRATTLDGHEIRAVFERGSANPYLPLLIHDATSGVTVRFAQFGGSTIAIRLYDANGAFTAGRLVWRENGRFRMGTVSSDTETDPARTTRVVDIDSRLADVRAKVLREAGIDIDPAATRNVASTASGRWASLLHNLSPLREAHAQEDVELQQFLRVLELMFTIAASDDMASFVLLPMLWIIAILSGNFAFVTGGSRFTTMSAASADAKVRGEFGPDKMPIDLDLRLSIEDAGDCTPNTSGTTTTTLMPGAAGTYELSIGGRPVVFQPPGNFRTQDTRTVSGGTIARDVTLTFNSDGTVSGTGSYAITGSGPCSSTLRLSGAWRTVLRRSTSGVPVLVAGAKDL